MERRGAFTHLGSLGAFLEIMTFSAWTRRVRVSEEPGSLQAQSSLWPAVLPGIHWGFWYIYPRNKGALL